MKKWELLKKAYDNYPKGTKFKSPYDDVEFTSEGIFNFISYLNEGKKVNITNSNQGCIYLNGKWATIVTEQEPKKIELRFQSIYNSAMVSKDKVEIINTTTGIITLAHSDIEEILNALKELNNEK